MRCFYHHILPTIRQVSTDEETIDTMKIDEYISSLRKKNIVVFVRDNRIAVNASKEALTPEITAELTARKQEILDFYGTMNIASDGEDAARQSADFNLAKLEHFKVQESYEIAYQQRKEFFRFQQIGMFAFNVVRPILIPNLDLEILNQAILKLVERHEILRTLHVLENGVARQKIIEEVSIEDYLAKPDPYKEASTEPESFSEVYGNCFTYRFDFEKDFLIAFKVGENAEGQEGTIIIIHHSIADAVAGQIVCSELMQIYDCLKNNRKVQLPELPLQPKEYAFLISDLENSSASKDFFIKKFKESLLLNGDSYADILCNEANRYRLNLDKEIEELYNREGLPQKLTLENVYGHVAHIIQEKDGGTYTIFLDAELSDKLKALSRRYNTTLYMFVTSLYVALVGKVKGLKSVRMLVPFSMRTSKEVENMISWMASESLACVTIDNTLDVPNFVQSVSSAIMEVSQHKHYGHEKVMNDLDVTLDFMAPNYLNLVTREEIYEGECVVHNREGVYTHFHFDTTITAFSNGMHVHNIYKHSYLDSDEVVAFWDVFSDMVEIIHDTPEMQLTELIDVAVTEKHLAEAY